VNKDQLVITTEENVINIYYTKRTDLSYTVNYLEKGTNKVLSSQKLQGNMTFEDIVNSINEVITIDGYNYDLADKDTLTITIEEISKSTFFLSWKRFSRYSGNVTELFARMV